MEGQPLSQKGDRCEPSHTSANYSTGRSSQVSCPKGKVPWNEEEYKMRELQACRHKAFLILPCLCSRSRGTPAWELDGCLSHLHLGSGSSQAPTASPSGAGRRKALISPTLAAFHLSASRFLSLPDISEALSCYDNAGSVYNSCSRAQGTGC